jgi:hypothetical protein
MKVLVALLLLMTIAHAEEVKKLQVTHESEPMTLVVQPDSTIEISYITLPPLLREAGVKPGQVLVQGKWTDRDSVLEGQAYAFVHGCEPIPYPVRGVVNRETGVLVVIGPMPMSCTDRTLIWKEGSVMTFDQPPSSMTKREKEKKKERVVERVKPKPKSKPKSVSPYSPYEYNWREQWRW